MIKVETELNKIIKLEVKMILYYTDIKESVYLEKTDEIEEYGDEFEYEPEECKKNEKLADFLIERYFTGLNVND